MRRVIKQTGSFRNCSIRAKLRHITRRLLGQDRFQHAQPGVERESRKTRDSSHSNCLDDSIQHESRTTFWVRGRLHVTNRSGCTTVKANHRSRRGANLPFRQFWVGDSSHTSSVNAEVVSGSPWLTQGGVKMGIAHASRKHQGSYCIQCSVIDRRSCRHCTNA